ncbi:Transcriptional regulator/sugar kinase [Dehalogenimonas alkenigignens]|uniref:Transcriptional regulator/sugar kinase n=2 Tax=Dehalogenimonas alkenigignens TaxID=1217799 RepID=A0A0W0GJ16_9CHLR|nr:Transcriptional regulator/sugar kinase [Dehalogenimonas alkenigignens]
MMNLNSVVLGIDLGGTKILSAAVDRQGKVLCRDLTPTPVASGHPGVIEAIKESAGRAIGHKPFDTKAVGLAAAGLVESAGGIVHTSPNLPGWTDVSITQELARTFGKPVFIINDAHAAAIGELKYGAGRGCRHFIFITLSTGIGGGLVLDGKIYEGFSGFGGEIGHMVIDDDGPECACGNRGCWEMLASGKALEREARRRIASGEPTSILSYCRPEPERAQIDCLNAKTIHTAAVNGDILALELIKRHAYYVGVGLANIVNIFNPERVIIGGGLSNIGDLLLKPAIEEAARRAFKQPFKGVRFMKAELGADAGVIGAAALAWNHVM